MYLLSVIIPIYNVEKFIEKSIRSIIDEDLKNIEIILINDGSPDNSKEICKYYFENYKNILYVEQNNMGLSGARNKGLENSTGKYIMFLDGDDFIEKNSLKRIFEEIADDSLDILLGECKYYFNKNKNYIKRKFDDTGVMSGEDMYTFLSLNNLFLPMAWLNIYRREFLIENKLEFKEGILHEDTEFTPRALITAKKVKYINHPFYVYLQRTGTITTSYNPKRSIHLIKAAKSLIEFNKLKDNKYLWNYINYLLFRALRNIAQLKRNDPVRKKVKKLFMDSKLFSIESSLIKYNLLKLICRFNYELCILIFKLEKLRLGVL